MRTGAASARQLVRNAAEKLQRAGVPEPAASAEVLMSELLGVRRGELGLYDEPLSGEQAATYEAWISRRKNREPVQRILGYAYFRNIVLDLNEATLIPRPDTESVVEAALEAIDRRNLGSRESGVEKEHYPLLPTPYSLERSEAKRQTILDLGTGSGAIAISLAGERPSCEVHATDTSEAALEVARQNAERAGAKVHFHRADVVSGLEDLYRSVSLLVSNPPYVKSDDLRKLMPEVRQWDPPGALDGGPDGLAFYRRILRETAPLLKIGADVVLEVGDDQAEAVLELGSKAGYTPLGTRPDLTGTLRAVLMRWEAG